ncbi:MAG: MFS transporter [Dehalococcoidales bacterium]|nr:MFS transporter [Dehalococcoidales bacterium]
MSTQPKQNIFYGYIIVAASIFILTIMHGVASTYGVFFGSLQQELNTNRAIISGANSVFSLLVGLAGILVGGLTDRFGPKKVIAVSGVLLAVGLLLMSRLNSIWELYFYYSFIIGVASASGNVALLSTTTRWFLKNRSLMTGIVKVGTGLGMFIIPAVAGWLIEAYDWRLACVILGIIGAIGIVPASILLKRDPGESGLKPLGSDEAALVSKLSGGVHLTFVETLKTPMFWIFCSMYFFTGYVTQSIMIHIVPYATDGDIPIAAAAITASLIGGASIAGRLVIGRSGDRLGTRKSIIICYVILLASLTFLQLTGGQWMLYLFALAYGFAHGGFYTVISPMVADLFGMKSHGVNYGMALFIASIGAGIGPFITGLIYDSQGSYHLAFIILIALSLIAFILCLTIRPVKRKEVSLADGDILGSGDGTSSG